jgi:hypothetical protein
MKKAMPVETTTQVDESSGVVSETIRKGLLNQTTKSIRGGGAWHEAKGDDELAIESLSGFRQRARAVLEAGLRSDLLPSVNLRATLLNEGKVEPLSDQEIAADLIDKIDAVLQFENKGHILDALQLAVALHDFTLANGLNDIAVSGHKAGIILEAGRKRPKVEADRKRELARAAVLALFKEAPVWKPQGAGPIAKQIAPALMRAYRTESLVKEGAQIMSSVRGYISDMCARKAAK